MEKRQNYTQKNKIFGKLPYFKNLTFICQPPKHFSPPNQINPSPSRHPPHHKLLSNSFRILLYQTVKITVKSSRPAPSATLSHNLDFPSLIFYLNIKGNIYYTCSTCFENIGNDVSFLFA